MLSLENVKTKEGSKGSLPLPKECGAQGAMKKMEPDLSQECQKQKEGIFSSVQQEEFRAEARKDFMKSDGTEVQKCCGNLHSWRSPVLHRTRP